MRCRNRMEENSLTPKYKFSSLKVSLNLQANYKMLVQLSPWNWIRSNNFLVSIPHVTQTSDIEETIN